MATSKTYGTAMKTIIFALFFSLLTALTVGCSRYDAKIPDTKANRKGFQYMTEMEPDSVQANKIYVYADEFSGIDPLYCMAFHVEQTGIDKIIRKLNMSKKDAASWTGHFSVPASIVWWNADERKKSNFYSARVEHPETEYYLWHNPQTGKCQFMMVCF